MTGLELRKVMVLSGTGVAKFEEHVDHLFVHGDCPAEAVVKALENAPRDLSTTVAKALQLMADERLANGDKTEGAEAVEPPDFLKASFEKMCDELAESKRENDRLRWELKNQPYPVHPATEKLAELKERTTVVEPDLPHIPFPGVGVEPDRLMSPAELDLHGDLPVIPVETAVEVPTEPETPAVTSD